MSDPIVYGPFISAAQARAQGLKYYFTGKPCKHGHTSVRQLSNRACLDCQKANVKRYCASEKGNNTRSSYNSSEKAKQMKHKYHQTEAGIASKRRAWSKAQERYASGDPVYIAQRRVACKKSKEKNKLKINAYIREVRQTNPQYLVRNRTNSRLHALLSAIGSSKAHSFSETVSCTPGFLAEWLEAKFSEGMTWENHGQWHIDHIRPCASFDLTDPKQQKQCFHYTNLQPLWAEDNLRKSDHWDEPMAA